jgi:hypothetical protein
VLANAPKDRSPDHLIGIAFCHPAFEDAREKVGAVSLARRIDRVADTSKPLPERAIAAWYGSGIECGDERRVGLGDLNGLMHAFRHLGVPADLIDATRVAAIRTQREARRRAHRAQPVDPWDPGRKSRGRAYGH